MHHKKPVTDAVRAANRANAHSSTGPRTNRGKSISSNNAMRHGILARKVEFDTDEQRAEFLELRECCKTELQPKGLLETFIGDDDLPLNRGWDCERMVVRAVAGNDKRYSTTRCGPTVVQGQAVQALKTSQNNDNQQGDHLEIEAVMGSTLESVTRYQAKLKRDLYRAIETLRKMQAERREGVN